MTHVISWLLVALVVTDWWAVVLAGLLRRAHPDVEQFGPQFWRLMLEAISGTAAAALATAFLLGYRLPPATGTIILVIALVATGGPGLIFLGDYYLGRFLKLRRKNDGPA